MQPRALPHLASGHGLSAFITVPPPRQWWLDALNATDPVAAELLVGENTVAHTVLNFNSNAAWYPLFVEFSRTLSYDVIWEFQVGGSACPPYPPRLGGSACPPYPPRRPSVN